MPIRQLMRTAINKNGKLTMRFLGFYKGYINISSFTCESMFAFLDSK